MKKNQENKNDKIEEEIKKVFELMGVAERGSKEYNQLLDNLDKLMDLKYNYKKKKSIDWNTLLVVSGNILGIAMILWWEQGHVVTSKALAFVLKGRV